jgi:arginase
MNNRHERSAIATLIGLPWDARSSFLRGAAAAPPLIREALFSPASNLWTEAGIDIHAPGVLTDAGDLELPQSDEALGRIETAIRDLVATGTVPVALGGDHAITYPVLRGLGPSWRGLTVLHIDAHPDLYDEFDGSRHSHACPFARVMEAGLADRLVQVGIRTANGHQRAQAARFGVESIDMGAWLAGTRPRLAGPVYVSIDLDGIDPAFAPGVSHREPGGLSTRDVIALIQALPSPVAGADLVEFNPGQDAWGLTAPVAAKLVKELVGAIGALGR